MPLEFRIMSEEPPVDKLKLALVGREKHGKSRLGSTGRKAVLVHDFDNRAEALSRLPGVYVLSYIEPQWPKFPESAQLFLDILGQLESSLDMHDLLFFLNAKGIRTKYDGKVGKETIIRTNMIDSIQTFGKAFQNYALAGQKDIRREITFSGQKVYLPGGWDAWNAEMIPVENSVLRLLALPSDTIIILHETAEETADSTSEKPKFTGRIGVFPVRYQRLIKYFNELWHVKLTQVTEAGKLAYKPRVYPQPTYEFDAATAMLLDPLEDPDIAAIIVKHEQRMNGTAKLQSGQIPTKGPQLTAGPEVKIKL
jgi:hypothetical protein